MVGTLEKAGANPVAGKGQAAALNSLCGTPVVAAFVSSARMERDCIRLLARTHPEVRAAAVLAGGRELLEQLRSGLNPQVLVLDALLPDMGILTLIQEIRALHLEPEPILLIAIPAPEQGAARRAVQAFGDCQLILKPFRMKELFDEIYLLGAGADEYRLYRARSCCRRLLRELRADPAMSGCDYIEQMLLYALTAERSLPMASLYQLVAQDNDTQESSITAAVSRLSQKMQRQGTPLYRELCQRCGLQPGAVLPNGKLLKALLECLQQEVQ